MYPIQINVRSHQSTGTEITRTSFTRPTAVPSIPRCIKRPNRRPALLQAKPPILVGLGTGLPGSPNNQSYSHGLAPAAPGLGHCAEAARPGTRQGLRIARSCPFPLTGVPNPAPGHQPDHLPPLPNRPHPEASARRRLGASTRHRTRHYAPCRSDRLNASRQFTAKTPGTSRAFPPDLNPGVWITPAGCPSHPVKGGPSSAAH
jgi:hypothetical protein